MTQKVIWLFGLSGAGKTTLSNHLKIYFDGLNIASVQLDGDALRSGINSDLGFTPIDRSENIRRTAEIAKLFFREGLLPIVSAITPYENDRIKLSKIIGENRVLKFFVDSPLAVCESRDIKGLYRKARESEIENFTGVGDVFELPQSDFIRVDTSNITIDASANFIKHFLNEHS
ncbi:MAG: adenylyl-sulfate kinase [Agriterribacter sp.]